MTKSPLRSSAGFTYIAALVMVVILGIMLSQAAQLWSTKMKREREVELIFRGRQVRDALRRWYKFKVPVSGTPGAATATATAATVVQASPQGPSPPDLKALLNGSDSVSKAHYLRPSNLKVRDPDTGKEMDWELYKDPGTQKVTGVYLKSAGEPLKQGNFPSDLEPTDFEQKKKYSDWVFIYNKIPKPGAAGGGARGAPGSTLQTTGAGGAAGTSTPSGGAAGTGTPSGGAGGAASPGGSTSP